MKYLAVLLLTLSALAQQQPVPLHRLEVKLVVRNGRILEHPARHFVDRTLDHLAELEADTKKSLPSISKMEHGFHASC